MDTANIPKGLGMGLIMFNILEEEEVRFFQVVHHGLLGAMMQMDVMGVWEREEEVVWLTTAIRKKVELVVLEVEVEVETEVLFTNGRIDIHLE